MQITSQTAQDKYYTSAHSENHTTGDVWSKLPTLGNFPGVCCSGIVITPSCDLAWSKSSTITYLPIITFNACIAFGLFMPEIRSALKTRLSNLKCNSCLTILNSKKVIDIGDLEFIDRNIGEAAKGPGNKKDADAAIHITQTIGMILRSEEADYVGLMKSMYSDKLWLKLKRELVTNSHSTSMHFLPPDQFHTEEYSAVPKPSFILLRHPLTVPIEFLNIASRSYPDLWNHDLQSSSLPEVIKILSANKFPFKVVTLKIDFLHDVLTRYLILYTRIGSPDFTPDAVEIYATDLEG